jgi:hypothetical protein
MCAVSMAIPLGFAINPMEDHISAASSDDAGNGGKQVAMFARPTKLGIRAGPVDH